MAKQNEIKVKTAIIKTMRKNGMDFLCITDIARQKNSIDPNGVIANWMRNRNTMAFGKRFTIRILIPSNSRGLKPKQD